MDLMITLLTWQFFPNLSIDSKQSPSKIPVGSFAEISKLILKFIRNDKDPKKPKQYEKEQSWRT